MNKKTMKYIFPALWNASYTMIMLDVLNWKNQITADGQEQPVSIGQSVSYWLNADTYYFGYYYLILLGFSPILWGE